MTILGRPFRVRRAPPKNFVRGIPDEVKPVRGIDAKSQAKLVLREGEFARVVMMTDAQDGEFLLEDRGEYWLIDKEVRREILLK